MKVVSSHIQKTEIYAYGKATSKPTMNFREKNELSLIGLVGTVRMSQKIPGSQVSIILVVYIDSAAALQQITICLLIVLWHLDNILVYAYSAAELQWS